MRTNVRVLIGGVLLALMFLVPIVGAQDIRRAYARVTGVFAEQTNGIAVTSTDGVTISNNTPATVGAPVQMSPRLKWCGTAYNSVSTLSEPDCWFAEVLPSTAAGTTASTFALSSNTNGGAASKYFVFATNGFYPQSDGALILGGPSNRWSNFYALITNSSFYNIGLTKWVDGNAPTISSGFGSSPSVATSNGTGAFTVNVGTGGVATSGVVGLPTATTGWNCFVNDLTAAAAHVAYNTRQTVSTTASATFENQTTSTGAAVAWAASDILRVSCFGY